MWPHLYVDRRAFGQDSLIESTLKLKISMALCTHKSRMETNKKEKKGECLGRELGALIKFGRENGSRPKVWITFLFDELSRLTTGNVDIKLVRELLTKIEYVQVLALAAPLHWIAFIEEGSLQKLRWAGRGCSQPSWRCAKVI